MKEKNRKRTLQAMVLLALGEAALCTGEILQLLQCLPQESALLSWLPLLQCFCAVLAGILLWKRLPLEQLRPFLLLSGVALCCGMIYTAGMSRWGFALVLCQLCRVGMTAWGCGTAGQALWHRGRQRQGLYGGAVWILYGLGRIFWLISVWGILQAFWAQLLRMGSIAACVMYVIYLLWALWTLRYPTEEG